VRVTNRLPLELQVGFFDLFECELNGSTGSRLERNDAARDTGELAFPAALIFDWLPQDDTRLLSKKPLELGGATQWPLDAGRTDFQLVGSAGDNVSSPGVERPLRRAAEFERFL